MRRTSEFDQLYREHAAAAWRVAWVILRHPDDAADAVSEAFSRLYAAGLPAGADARAYLLAAVRNAAIDVMRRTRRQPLAEPDQADATAVVDQPDPAVASENREHLARAFAELPERWRSALWLIDVEELPTRDAGTILGVTPNTAAQLASRARGRVRQHFLQSHVANHVRPGCRAAAGLLGAHAAGTLPPGRRAKVDAHLAGCADCTARRADLDDLRVALRTVPPPFPLALLDWSPAPSRGTLLALLERLQAAPASAAAEAAAASPILSAAGERLAAAATATMLVAGMSAAALRGGGLPRPPTEADPPAVVAAAAPAPPAPLPQTELLAPEPAGSTPTLPPAAPDRSGPAPLHRFPAVVAAAPATAPARPPASTGPVPTTAAGRPPASRVVPAVLGATAPLVAGLTGAGRQPAALPGSAPAVAPPTAVPPGGIAALPAGPVPTVPLALPKASPPGRAPEPESPATTLAPPVGGVLRSAPVPATVLPTAAPPPSLVQGPLPAPGGLVPTVAPPPGPLAAVAPAAPTELPAALPPATVPAPVKGVASTTAGPPASPLSPASPVSPVTTMVSSVLPVAGGVAGALAPGLPVPGPL